LGREERFGPKVAHLLDCAAHSAGKAAQLSVLVFRAVFVCRELVLMTARSLVSIVDDDASVRESLPPLVETFGFAAGAFESAEAFLASDALAATRCLILDVAMPGMSGPDLQRELARRGLELPTIFITARRDEALRQRLLDRGAAECLFKPFGETVLLQALEVAFSSG
jgi:FixJ family two-component response regulator